ncbi:Glycosyl transferase family 2 [Maribacter dokdonensis]|uniref:Glycosyl transferase family 2 n=2 Tax=Maribacter dokdonensis TaxID=320912 RepID=A0ABY0UIE5_9FLAO|nr:Glycosyl transferase family 2 [Maribacter dokdonensis]
MHKPAIVVVAFNREHSLKRLLLSISNATYTTKDIPLIISIDHANDNQQVKVLADNFNWPYGIKKVIYQKKNLGLRKHILQCGAHAVTYDSVIILEDDLFVSPNFYEFTSAALEFSADKSYISGISLYSHQFNVHSRSNFSPLIDGYDNWYFQFASSWGQAWTKNQWLLFMTWYNKQESLTPNASLPANVTRWSDKSWLKYFIAYLVESDTYFLYPRTSYSTNFSDMGTHIGKDTTTFQVPLDFGNNIQYRFSNLQESNSIYDVFYENKKLHNYLNVPKKQLCIDLYGKKEIQKSSRYIITDNILNYKIIKTFGRSLKPHDANIIHEIPGEDIFLYDCQKAQINPYKFNTYRKIMYSIKSLNRWEAKIVLFKRIEEMWYNTLTKLGL